jgi:hypothetical protein
MVGATMVLRSTIEGPSAPGETKAMSRRAGSVELVGSYTVSFVMLDSRTTG